MKFMTTRKYIKRSRQQLYVTCIARILRVHESASEKRYLGQKIQKAIMSDNMSQYYNVFLTSIFTIYYFIIHKNKFCPSIFYINFISN
jgi:hypothetical protein